MTAPIPGEVVFNPFLKCNMHKVADYEDGERAIYSDMLPKFAAHLKRRIKNHYQNIITIDGKPGSGKSNLMIQLALELDPKLDLDDSYVLEDLDFSERLERIMSMENKSNINLFDEGSFILNSINSRRAEDNGIVVLLDTLRSWEMTSIICIPKFAHLNKRVVDHLIDYRIVCPRKPLIPGYKARGFYEIYAPNQNDWTDKTYWDCIGAGVYKKLPSNIEEPYKRIKAERQKTIVTSYVDMVKRKRGITDDDSDN